MSNIILKFEWICNSEDCAERGNCLKHRDGALNACKNKAWKIDNPKLAAEITDEPFRYTTVSCASYKREEMRDSSGKNARVN